MEPAIQPAGTLLMYAGCRDGFDEVGRGFLSAEEEASVLTHQSAFSFRHARAEREFGLLAEFFRSSPGTVCSQHAGARMAARGSRADRFTADHPWNYGYGPGSPFHKLCQEGGKVLLLGSRHDEVTLPTSPSKLRPTSRDFVPWRFSYACPRCAWIGSSCRRPKNLNIQGVRAQVAREVRGHREEPGGGRRPALHVHAAARRAMEIGAHHQRHRASASGVQAAHQDADRAALGRDRSDAFWALLASGQIVLRKVDGGCRWHGPLPSRLTSPPDELRSSLPEDLPHQFPLPSGRHPGTTAEAIVKAEHNKLDALAAGDRGTDKLRVESRQAGKCDRVRTEV